MTRLWVVGLVRHRGGRLAVTFAPDAASGLRSTACSVAAVVCSRRTR